MDSYEWLKNALYHCGTFLLDLSEEEIGYHLFEEFDGDSISVLNEDFLTRLLSSGRISREIVDMSLELSSKFRALENTELWHVKSVKENQKWFEILALSDQIQAMLT